MSKDVIIRNQTGGDISLNVEQDDDNIIITVLSIPHPSPVIIEDIDDPGPGATLR
jgi:hypothetical protein